MSHHNILLSRVSTFPSSICFHSKVPAVYQSNQPSNSPTSHLPFTIPTSHIPVLPAIYQSSQPSLLSTRPTSRSPAIYKSNKPPVTYQSYCLPRTSSIGCLFLLVIYNSSFQTAQQPLPFLVPIFLDFLPLPPFNLPPYLRPSYLSSLSILCVHHTDSMNRA